MIQGETREFKEFKKYVGVGEFTVLGFNLDRASIIAKCGYDPGQEQVYAKPAIVNIDGHNQQVNTANIAVFMKSVSDPSINMRLGFHLEERDDISAKKNTKYVNSKCQSTYVLLDWFTKNDHRKAVVGECDFLHFMRSWLSNFKWFEEGQGGAKYPLKETFPLFKGNFNALNDLAKRYPNQSVGVLCGIRDTEKGSKQDTCNRAFLPGYLVGKIQDVLVGSDPNSHVYLIKEFLKTVEGEYGYKNFYGNNYTFREYDPKTNVVAGSNSAVLGNTNKANADDLQY